MVFPQICWMASLLLDVQTFWQSFWRFIQFLTMRTLHILISRYLWIDFSDFKPFRCCQSCDRKTTYSCVMVAEFVPGVCTISVLLFLFIGCVVVEIYGCGSNSASVPTLARFETASLEQLDRALLEVHKGTVLCWTRWMTSIGQVVDTHVLGKVDVWYGSGVKYENLVERCVKQFEEKGIVVLAWESVGQMVWRIRFRQGDGRERGDVHKTKSELCGSQLTMCLPKWGSCFKSRSEYVIEDLSLCCCNKDGAVKSHVKNFVIVFKGLKKKMTRWRWLFQKILLCQWGVQRDEFGRVHNIFLGCVRHYQCGGFWPRIVARIETDGNLFVNQLEVYRKRLR